MMRKIIESGKPVTVSEVKNILSRREKEGELHHEQKLALEYARKFALLSEAGSKSLIGQLLKLKIPRFKERHAAKIVDFMPENEDALKTIFLKESVTLKKDEIEKILKVVDKAR